MRSTRATLAAALVLATGAAQAAGPLFTTDGAEPRPYRWDTSNGPIPVWTDGGGAFTWDVDGVTPFITIERANEITQFAFDQWSDVPTSTFAARIAGTIESQTGIADVTGANAAEIYTVENGYGFWVLYDTDGDILEDFFGVPKWAVLGIAFPEWASADGTITEATAVMNGWYVWADDGDGNRQAGVFTHEFGHAVNLSHSQVNGQLAYASYPASWGGPELVPGVPGCGVEPVHRYDFNPAWDPSLRPANPAIVETMFPFIDTRGQAAIEQSTIDHPDDVAAISDLYPSAGYAATRGSISGVLRLKDGSTEYSGINVIARNVNDPLNDAVSGMTGMLTQGKVGPDGRYVINNLTPGEFYVVYFEEIVAGGYPTTPNMLMSEPEYWNAAEGADPVLDNACDATPILAEAGVAKTADFTFNGYRKGVQFTPIVSAHLTDLAKNGRSSAGVAMNTAFKWDQNKGLIVLPPEFKANHGALNANGQKMLVQADLDGNGIQQPVLWSDGKVIELGDLNGDSCGGSSQNGSNSASGFDLDASGKTATGFAYIDTDGDGNCQSSRKGEVLPFIWDQKDGMRLLDTTGRVEWQWVRGQAISGNGEVIVGSMGGFEAVAWVNEGPMINLGAEFGARDTYAINHDGNRVALDTRDGVLLWNAHTGETQSIGGFHWCVDAPYTDFFGTDLCELYGAEFIQEIEGAIPVLPIDMTDDGSIIAARRGTFFTGFDGVLWIEDMGWITMQDFFHKQGVVEAKPVPFNNPVALSANGTELAGGITGASFSWLVDMEQVYVCDGGVSVLTGFPGGLREKLAEGASFGRCEFID